MSCLSNAKKKMDKHPQIRIDKKIHFCEVCNERFLNAGCLMIHLKIHTSEKSHVSKVCNKGFSQVGHLKNHLQTHTRE